MDMVVNSKFPQYTGTIVGPSVLAEPNDVSEWGYTIKQ